MSILIVRSIPLSRETQDAWRSQGARFLRRSRDPNAYRQYTGYFDHVLNLGNSSLTVDHARLWNKPTTVQTLTSPRKSREQLHDLLPPVPRNSSHPAWHKRAGRGGSGKIFYPEGTPRPTFCSCHNCDWQEHIEGTEYRVNTVGSRVVQVHERTGQNGARTYTWRGLTGTPRSVKRLARTAASRFPHSVLGWDIILDREGRAYVLEGNTSSGINLSTAERIVKAMHTNANDFQ